MPKIRDPAKQRKPEPKPGPKQKPPAQPTRHTIRTAANAPAAWAPREEVILDPPAPPPGESPSPIFDEVQVNTPDGPVRAPVFPKHFRSTTTGPWAKLARICDAEVPPAVIAALYASDLAVEAGDSTGDGSTLEHALRHVAGLGLACAELLPESQRPALLAALRLAFVAGQVSAKLESREAEFAVGCTKSVADKKKERREQAKRALEALDSGSTLETAAHEVAGTEPNAQRTTRPKRVEKATLEIRPLEITPCTRPECPNTVNQSRRDQKYCCTDCKNQHRNALKREASKTR
jgi:hypothetical protein